MKSISIKKLAETVIKLREEKGYTKEKLGNLTCINRIIIGRIEREDFILKRQMNSYRNKLMFRSGII